MKDKTAILPTASYVHNSKNGGIIVLGAGIAGIAVGRALHAAGRQVCLLEQDRAVGGMARTDEVDGFLFDRAGHFLHLNNPDVQRFFYGLGVPLREIQRRAIVLLREKPVPYPLQYNMWALQKELRQAALNDLRTAQNASCQNRTSFEADLRLTWGDTLADAFFCPYHGKQWQRPLTELPVDCLGPYKIKFDLAMVEQGYREPIPYIGYNYSFLYPDSGRIGDLVEAMAEPIRDRIHLNTRPVQIDPYKHICRLNNGQVLPYEKIVSTIPLPHFLDLISENIIPKEQLRCASIANIRVGFRGHLKVPYHWAYLPEPNLPIYRVGFPSNIHPRTVHAGHASLSLEYGIPSAPQRRPSANQLAQIAIEKLRYLGWIKVEEIVLIKEHLLSPAYVMFRSEGRSAFRELKARLRANGIHLAGRYGYWDYYSMEETLLSGVKAAKEIDRNAFLP